MRIRHLVIALGCWSLTFVSSWSACLAREPGPSNESRSEFLGRYKAALVERERLLEKIRAAGTFTLSSERYELGAEGGETKTSEQGWKNEVEYRRNGAKTMLLWRQYEGNNIKSANTSYVHLSDYSHRERSFTLAKQPNAHYFLIKGRGNPDDPRFTQAMKLFINGYVDASICMGGIRVSDLLNSPTFRLTDMTRDVQEGRQVYTIHFTYIENTKAQTARSGWWKVVPEAGWALTEYEFTVGKGRDPKVRKHVVYDGVRDGLPIPKRVETLTEGRLYTGKGPKRKTFISRTSYSFAFTDFVHVTIPDETFSISPFSLPDVTPVAKNRRLGRAPIWLLGMAAVSLVVAVAFKVMSSRTQST